MTAIPRHSEVPNSNIVQALRGLAAIAVVIYHQRETLGSEPIVSAAVAHLHLGIDLFFIISGFVIGVSTQKTDRSDVSVFVLRRLFRIVPLAWAVLFLQLLIVHADVPSIFRSLFFFLEHPPLSFPVNPPQWTLSFEFFFYVIFALSIAVSHRYRCEISILLIIALSLLDYNLSAGVLAWPPILNSQFLLEFASGVVIAKGLLLAPSRLPRHTVLGLGSLMMLGGAALIYLRPPYSGITCFGAGCALLLAGLIFVERYMGSGVPRPFLWLGEISFTLYITQHFTSIFFQSKVFWTPIHKIPAIYNATGSCRLVIVLFVTLGISVLLHVAVEKPGITLGRKVIRRLQARHRPDRSDATPCRPHTIMQSMGAPSETLGILARPAA